MSGGTEKSTRGLLAIAVAVLAGLLMVVVSGNVLVGALTAFVVGWWLS